MITVDSAVIKNLQGTQKTREVTKKDNKKIRFEHPAQVTETHEADLTGSITAVNPFLFLQEVDEYSEEQAKLRESGKKMLESLNELRFSLIKGDLKERQITGLKAILDTSRVKFKFSELQSVIDDIVLRCEVELAKIEKSKQASR